MKFHIDEMIDAKDILCLWHPILRDLDGKDGYAAEFEIFKNCRGFDAGFSIGRKWMYVRFNEKGYLRFGMTESMAKEFPGYSDNDEFYVFIASIEEASWPLILRSVIRKYMDFVDIQFTKPNEIKLSNFGKSAGFGPEDISEGDSTFYVESMREIVKDFNKSVGKVPKAFLIPLAIDMKAAIDCERNGGEIIYGEQKRYTYNPDHCVSVTFVTR